MSLNLAAILLLSIALATCLVLALWSATKQPERTPRPRITRARTTDPELSRRRTRLMIAGTAIGIVAWLVSGWLIWVPLGPALAIGLTRLFAKPAVTRSQMLTALETWSRSLAGLFTGVGVSVELAIESSLASTPPELEPSVRRMVSRLAHRQPVERVLRLWADEVQLRDADMIAAALIQGSQQRQGGIAEALKALADSIAKRVNAQHDIDTEREGPISAVRYIAIIGLAFLVLGMVITDYTEPYRTPIGQVVLGAQIALFVLDMIWMRKIAGNKPEPRFLISTAPPRRSVI